MTADDVAQHCADELNAAEGLAYAVFVSTPEKPRVELENDPLKVQAYGYGESVVELDRGGGYVAELTAGILITRRLDGNVTRKSMCAFVAQLRAALRSTITDDGAARWIAEDVIVLWDRDALQTKNEFRSLFTATFREVQ